MPRWVSKMTVPFRTFALFGLALGMLALGYLFAPAPGAGSPLPELRVPKVEPAAAKSPAPTVVASRPPVPLLTPPRTSSYTPPAVDQAATSTTNTPTNKTTVAALTTDQPADAASGGNDAQAKRAIEFDGYKNVRGLAKGPDGLWRGRAMRGRTEIAVKVDASGNVSAE
jgi:hypothetical protein